MRAPLCHLSFLLLTQFGSVLLGRSLAYLPPQFLRLQNDGNALTCTNIGHGTALYFAAPIEDDSSKDAATTPPKSTPRKKSAKRKANAKKKPTPTTNKSEIASAETVQSTTNIEAINAEIASIEEDIRKLELGIQKIEEQVGSLQEEVRSLTEELNATSDSEQKTFLRNSIMAKEKSIAAKEESIAADKESIAADKERIAELTKQIGQLGMDERNRLQREESNQRYPYLASNVDTIERHLALDRSSMDPGQNATIYKLQEGFLKEDRSWIDYVQDERMNLDSTVLYRPQIVDNLMGQIQRLLESKRRRGLMIKGPQGVGKSYSLINLTRYLLASGKYWVTIIPDCEYWDDETDFFRFLLQSVGVDPDTVNPSGKDFLRKLISDIDNILSKRGMQWVFIFDQINRIFARLEFQQVKDVPNLPYPFFLMKKILKPGRIISIISASANNDVSHRENHGGFDVFEHPRRLDIDEIKLLYPTREMSEELEYATGYVPLYLNRWEQDEISYSSDVSNEIEFSLRKLSREQSDIWGEFEDSAINCLLKYPLTTSPLNFDRKFSFVHEERASTTIKYSVIALFPRVEEQYRKYFWEKLALRITEREADLLLVCKHPMTTQEMRGRMFEEIAKNRFVTKPKFADDIKKILTDANATVDEDLDADLRKPTEPIRMPGRTYENADYFKQGRYFIPIASNFPAADFLVSVRKLLIAFQFHVSASHNDVFDTLMKNAEEAEWNAVSIEKIIIVYLSPTVTITRKMEKKILKRTTCSDDDWVVTRFYSIRDFESLKDMQWNV